MTIRLRELIKNVRGCKTAAEERKVISKECATIRTSFKEEENQFRKRNISKLLFIHMMGYPTAFAQMECLRLIVSNSYGEKRMGYLGLMLLLDERQEVLMLVTNSLKNDLNHQNQYVVGLALCSLANISSSSMSRDLSGEVIKLLSHSNAYIRKKAILCAIRIVRKVPELLEQYVPKVRPMLVEKDHGLLITAISLIIEVCRIDPENIRSFKRAVGQLVKILKNLVSSGYAPEHDVNGITDPFLQVKTLALLRILGKGDTEASDTMNDILAQVASNTDGTKNVGNAILYECVQTIMAIESESGLRVLAINILGRFLMNRDNNIRYVALNTLTRVVHVDQQAVQRHRSTVVECLKDHDSSIRKRALDLTYALVNRENIKLLVRELLNYLIAADIEFRGEITAQICLLTERYAPTPKWHIDTILKVMSLAGHYVQPATVANTIHLIQNTPDLQAYAVHKLYMALVKDISRQSLVRTAVWVIGEFGDLLLAGGKNIDLMDVFQLLETIVKHPTSELETREFAMTAMLKLTDRLPDPAISERFLQVINVYRSSLTLEIQQRACEYFHVVQSLNTDKRADLLEHMPARERDDDDVSDYDDEYSSGAAESTAAAPAPTPSGTGDLLSLVSEPQVQTTSLLSSILGAPTPSPVATPGDSLIDLIGGGAPSAPVQATNTNSLLNLLGPSNPTPAPTASPLSGLFGGPAAPLTPVSPSLLGTASPSLLGSPQVAPYSPQASNPLAGLTPTPNSPSPVVNAGLAGLVPQQSPQPLAASGALPPFTAFEKAGVKVVFNFVKQPDNIQVTLINAVTTNAAPVPLENFSLQAAVPGYMKIQLNPASGNVVPPNNSGAVQQQMKIFNSMHGQQPSAIKLKIDFVVNGKPVGDQLVATLPHPA